MLLGASALGQTALGGLAAAETNYVDCEAQITITSQLVSAISIAGRVHVAAAITLVSAIQCAVTINEPVFGEVNLSAVIAIQSSLSVAVQAMQTLPNPGVSFTLSDRAGGA